MKRPLLAKLSLIDICDYDSDYKIISTIVQKDFWGYSFLPLDLKILNRQRAWRFVYDSILIVSIYGLLIVRPLDV